LGEVIAFSDGAQAQEDVELWTHELTHVMQYKELGIETFAAGLTLGLIARCDGAGTKR
jgi:hypothetical protein